MKRIVTLFCFLTITCCQHAMEHHKEEYQVIDIERSIDTHKSYGAIAEPTLELKFPTSNSDYKQPCYNPCTNKLLLWVPV